MSKLNWITKQNRIGSGIDVTITYSTHANGKKCTSFRFRNSTSDKITSTGYIKFALASERLYFAEATSIEGYALTDGSKFGDSKGVAIKGISDIKSGDFDLLFDKEEQLFYVDLSKNKRPKED